MRKLNYKGRCTKRKLSKCKEGFKDLMTMMPFAEYDLYDETKTLSDLAKDIEPALMYQRMLSKACEIYDNDIKASQKSTILQSSL